LEKAPERSAAIEEQARIVIADAERTPKRKRSAKSWPGTGPRHTHPPVSRMSHQRRHHRA